MPSCSMVGGKLSAPTGTVDMRWPFCWSSYGPCNQPRTGMLPHRLRVQVLHQELDGGGVGVDAVGALGEPVAFVGVDPQLAVDALLVERSLDLLGLGERHARVV